MRLDEDRDRRCVRETCAQGEENALHEPRLRERARARRRGGQAHQRDDRDSRAEGLSEDGSRLRGGSVVGHRGCRAHRARRARIEALRAEVWQPFERARACSPFRLSGLRAERVTERGRWLADLHVDRPLLVGEAVGMASLLRSMRARGGLDGGAGRRCGSRLRRARAGRRARRRRSREFDESLTKWRPKNGSRD